MTEKAFAALIAAIVLITALAGCGRGGAETGTDTAAVPTAAESAAVAETETEPETETEKEPVTGTATERIPETEPATEPAPVTYPAPATEPAPVTYPEPVTEPAPVTYPVPDTDPPSDPPSSGYSANGYPIEVRDGLTYVGGVLIVNKTYSLPSWYDPGGMTAECAAAFYAMQSAAAQDGISLFSISDYRSYDLQTWLYQTYVDRNGRELADTFSARPGHSEHQTGLAIDLNQTLKSFADTPEGKWVAERCWDFGFIIRYPEGKEWATGFMYEPWHVRYVGVELAAIMRDNGLTLEEYFGIDSVYR